MGIMGLEGLREQENGAAVAGALGTGEQLQNPQTAAPGGQDREEDGAGKGKAERTWKGHKGICGREESSRKGSGGRGMSGAEPEQGEGSQSVDPCGMGAGGENTGEASAKGWGTLKGRQGSLQGGEG